MADQEHVDLPRTDLRRAYFEGKEIFSAHLHRACLPWRCWLRFFWPTLRAYFRKKRPDLGYVPHDGTGRCGDTATVAEGATWGTVKAGE
jgi:hypothetical protein